jgi:UDPglucose--hexose-1-phosphate uridylyltransferase
VKRSFPPTASQDEIQSHLEEIYRREGLEAVMDWLYRWELEVGYISEERLSADERRTFRDPEWKIDFKLQINRGRTQYSPAPVADQDLPPLHCIICRENVGRPGKEGLRVFDFPLGEEPYFLQLTPFPLFKRHFVVIATEPQPQNVNDVAIARCFQFLTLAPTYTICSNSDVEWAGSSILEHQHFQAFQGLHLPVMEASVSKFGGWQQGEIRLEMLDYPLAAIRVQGRNETGVRRLASSLVRAWKALDPGRNTVNLVLRRAAGHSSFYLFLRNPDFRTPPELRHIKSEGVGVIEAAGEIIVPVPEDQNTLREIREGGLKIIRGILAGNNPVRGNRRERLQEVVEAALRSLVL